MLFFTHLFHTSSELISGEMKSHNDISFSSSHRFRHCLDSEITKVTEQLLQAIANSDYEMYKSVNGSRSMRYLYIDICLELYVIQRSHVLNLKP